MAGRRCQPFFLYIALRGLRLADLAGCVWPGELLVAVPGIAVYFVAVWDAPGAGIIYSVRSKISQLAAFFRSRSLVTWEIISFPHERGELLRTVVLKREEQVAISASLATIIVERIFDGVTMLAFVFVNLSELAKLTSSSGFVGNIQQVAIWGTAIFLAALLFFILAAIFPDRSLTFIEMLAKRTLPARMAEKIVNVARLFLGGLAALRSPKAILMVFGISVVIWLLETLKYWFVMHAFPFTVSFFTLMLMNGIVNLATTIPSAPGYIGTFDAPGIAVLTAYGVPKALGRLHPGAARGPVAAGHCAGGVLPAAGGYLLVR